MRRNLGFTLVETLVTVAIIAILAALLLGGVDRVRAAADRAGCVSNLKSLSSAILSYASEHDGFLPPGSRTGWGTFSRVLSPYTAPMKSNTMAADVFYCPANVRLNSPPAGGYPTGGQSEGYKGWSGYFFNYAINASIFPITNGDPNSSAFVQESEARVRLSGIPIPSRTVALLDMRTRAPGVGGPPSSGLANRNYFDPAHSNFMLGLVHQGKGNVLFLDGHVAAFDGNSKMSVISLPGREEPWWP